MVRSLGAVALLLSLLINSAHGLDCGRTFGHAGAKFGPYLNYPILAPRAGARIDAAKEKASQLVARYRAIVEDNRKNDRPPLDTAERRSILEEEGEVLLSYLRPILDLQKELIERLRAVDRDPEYSRLKLGIDTFRSALPERFREFWLTGGREALNLEPLSAEKLQAQRAELDEKILKFSNHYNIYRAIRGLRKAQMLTAEIQQEIHELVLRKVEFVSFHVGIVNGRYSAEEMKGPIKNLHEFLDKEMAVERRVFFRGGPRGPRDVEIRIHPFLASVVAEIANNARLATERRHPEWWVEKKLARVRFHREKDKVVLEFEDFGSPLEFSMPNGVGQTLSFAGNGGIGVGRLQAELSAMAMGAELSYAVKPDGSGSLVRLRIPAEN